MPTISGLDLSITSLGTDPPTWSVGVDYELELQPWDQGTWFDERVELVGCTPDGERVITEFVAQPWRSTGDGTSVVKCARQTPRVQLGCHELDVNPDGIVWVSWRTRGFIIEETTLVVALDTVWARVHVMPRRAIAAHAQSEPVTDNFGLVQATSG